MHDMLRNATFFRFFENLCVKDRPSRLFSAQQEALQRSSGWDWLLRLTVAEFGCRDGGRSMKYHPLEGVRRSLTPSFALRSGSTARTVGYSPGPCPRPPRSARSTTSAICRAESGTGPVKLGGPADVRAIFTRARHSDFGPHFAGDPWDDRPTLGPNVSRFPSAIPAGQRGGLVARSGEALPVPARRRFD